MNRGALVDSIITIEFNRWTGGPLYMSILVLETVMFYSIVFLNDLPTTIKVILHFWKNDNKSSTLF